MRFIVLVFFLLTGCGYQFAAGTLPGDVKLLHLPLAVNKTTEPLVENVLAPLLTAVLARQRSVELVDTESKAEAILQGTITAYSVTPSSYDSNDRISTYSATMTVHFSLKQQQDGKLLWQGTVQRQTTYTAAVDKNQQEDLESVAIKSLANDIADDLLYRLISKF